MRNDKRACIFEHEGFTYVCNFETMNLWTITEEDTDGPVTTLEITHCSPGVWAYRHEGSNDFYYENDKAFSEKLDAHYQQYLNRLIVGQDGRATHIPKAVPMLRVRQAD